MNKFRKKPISVLAHVWWKPGDIPGVRSCTDTVAGNSNDSCHTCGFVIWQHGLISKNMRPIIICPGDYIINDPQKGAVVYTLNELRAAFDTVETHTVSTKLCTKRQ